MLRTSRTGWNVVLWVFQSWMPCLGDRPYIDGVFRATVMRHPISDYNEDDRVTKCELFDAYGRSLVPVAHLVARPMRPAVKVR